MDKDTISKISKDSQGIFHFEDGFFYSEAKQGPILASDDGHEFIGFVRDEDVCCIHKCQRSARDCDLFGFIDRLQDEQTALSDSQKYIVRWYTCDGEDLFRWVDFGLTKDEIIANVEAQKYIEGADFIPADKIYSVEDIEQMYQKMCQPLNDRIHSIESRAATEHLRQSQQAKGPEH